MTRRALNIGITIGLRSPDESLWTNGIKQNALFLAKLFRNSPLGHRVVLLNTTEVSVSGDLAWDREFFPTLPFAQGCDDLDVLVELGGQIGPDETERIKSRGTRLISYCCGPEYVQGAEAMIFGRRLWSNLWINPAYDELWVIPQIHDLNAGYLQTLRRCPVRRVPFVWDPMAIEAASSELRDGGRYRPVSGPKRLSVIEPNIDVLKFCLYPILVAERAFRAAPEAIAYLHVANADRFVHDDTEFADLMRRLDIVAAHKASFIGRVDTPRFLADYTDVVVSHQWGLPLNYFQLECCWQGYPLVHNADLCSDLGYHYRGSDMEQAEAVLLHVLRHHDENWETYARLQREKIWKYRATNPELVETYDAALAELIARE